MSMPFSTKKNFIYHIRPNFVFVNGNDYLTEIPVHKKLSINPETNKNAHFRLENVFF